MRLLDEVDALRECTFCVSDAAGALRAPVLRVVDADGALRVRSFERALSVADGTSGFLATMEAGVMSESDCERKRGHDSAEAGRGTAGALEGVADDASSEYS